MKFENTAVAESVGRILAHSFVSPAFRLAKGRAISPDDCRQLEAAGIHRIDTVILEEDETDEREAALQLADRLLGRGLWLDAKPSGSVDLRAREAGLVQLEESVINKCNLLAESVTIATRRALDRVDRDERVATVKVIPYGVRSRVVSAISRYLNRYRDVVAVRTFRALKVGLIQTTSSTRRDPQLDKTREVVSHRLQPISATLGSVICCDHAPAAIQEAIIDQHRQGCDIIVLVGPTAIVDRGDMIPASIDAMGGRIEHYGMPVEPGHMLLLASYGAVPIIGSPTCIRSPRQNGFDLLLARYAAGLSVSGKDIMQMGVGGLL